MVSDLLLAVALAWHPLHASSAVVVVPAGSERGTVSLRVFAEDFPPGRDRRAIARYLEQRLHLSRDRQRLILTLEQERMEGDAQILELSFPTPGTCRGVSVWNAVLVERFADQVNLVQVRCGTSVKHLVFGPGEGPKRL